MRRIDPIEIKWYGRGLRFECTGCGKCCRDHGEYTYVYLVKGDIERMADLLELTKEEFLAQYCTRDLGLTYLRIPDGEACVFLQEGKCKVYEARPKQCRSWPFWVENLDKKIWDKEVLPLCPGVGKGKLHTAEEIEKTAWDLEKGFEEPI